MSLTLTIVNNTKARPELLGLPVELRLQIYKHVVADHQVKVNNTSPFIQEPELLRVSRLIREEALPEFYKQAVFVVPHLNRLERLAKALDSTKLAMIRRIHMEEDFSAFDSISNARSRFESLHNEVKGTSLRLDAILLPQAVMAEGAEDRLIWWSYKDVDDYENVMEPGVDPNGDAVLTRIRRRSKTVADDSVPYPLALTAATVSTDEDTEHGESRDLEHWLARCVGNLSLQGREDKSWMPYV